MDLKLKDKVVLINGVTGGVGKALCKAFAREGSKLAINARNKEKLDALVAELALPADRLIAVVGDVTSEEDNKAFVEAAVDYYGGIDVVVPNAGYEGEWCRIGDATKENYMKVMDVNLFGVMYLCKYAAPHLIARGEGAIVVLASNGSYMGCDGMGAYIASKHAVAGMTKCIALELGPHGIHVNYVCPGGIDTPMIERIEVNTFGDSKTHEEAEATFAAGYLNKRYQKPEEVADICLFFASEVSQVIMGSGIRTDAGMDATC